MYHKRAINCFFGQECWVARSPLGRCAACVPITRKQVGDPVAGRLPPPSCVPSEPLKRAFFVTARQYQSRRFKILIRTSNADHTPTHGDRIACAMNPLRVTKPLPIR